MMWDINMIDKCCFELKKKTGMYIFQLVLVFKLWLHAA